MSAQQAIQPPPGAAEVAGNDQQPQQQGMWSIIKTLLFRMVFIYMVANIFHSFRAPPGGGTPGGQQQVQLPTGNLVPRGAPLDLYIYISENEELQSPKTDALLLWHEKGIFYGDWTTGPNGDGSYFMESDIQLSETVKNNGSLYLHCYFTPAGSPAPDYPTTAHRIPGNSFPTFSKTVRLNKYKRRYFHKTVNLLTGVSDAPVELIRQADDPAYEVISHWHENLTINVVDDHTAWTKGQIPPPLDQLVEFEPTSNRYYPIIFFNDYWNLHEEYMPVNDTLSSLHLRLTLAPLSLFRLQMYAGQMMRNKWFALLGQDDMQESPEEQDSLKRAILETNVYLLAITVIVSILHTVFEFLAFKNDIQFWRTRKSLEGLSVRSVFFNNFQCLVVLLYILDNDANMMIRISIFVSLLIEMWKVTKVVDISIDRERRVFGVFPRIVFADKSSYTESHTREYDRVAFKYLSWALFPLLLAYAVYSVVYQEHKGWYSWVLSMMYGFLLTFGFISMTPQLFINYKLKSVAHLPWRMLTYKFLNTFIDDLFAFVIKMPNLYRLGCLRDDIIFFIYLYQRYKYPVDKARVNEFGVSGEDLEQINNPSGEQQQQLQQQQTKALPDSKKHN